MSKLDHTKVATWTFTSDDYISKTVTGLTAYKSLIIVHKPSGSAAYCDVWIEAGTECAKKQSESSAYRMGTLNDYDASGKSIIIVPTGTSVTMRVHNAKDDIFYVYQ